MATINEPICIEEKLCSDTLEALMSDTWERIFHILVKNNNISLKTCYEDIEDEKLQ